MGPYLGKYLIHIGQTSRVYGMYQFFVVISPTVGAVSAFSSVILTPNVDIFGRPISWLYIVYSALCESEEESRWSLPLIFLQIGSGHSRCNMDCFSRRPIYPIHLRLLFLYAVLLLHRCTA